MSYTFRGIALPDRLKESLDAYFLQGRPTGGFLGACLANNLSAAVLRSDDDSMEVIPAVVAYIHNYAPHASWGSSTNIAKWLLAKEKEALQCASVGDGE